MREEKSCCRTCPVSLLGFAAPPELCSPGAAEHIAASSELAEHLAQYYTAFTCDRPLVTEDFVASLGTGLCPTVLAG